MDAMTVAEADAKFLRRILFVLVMATAVTGSIAGYATVLAGQDGPVKLQGAVYGVE